MKRRKAFENLSDRQQRRRIQEEYEDDVENIITDSEDSSNSQEDACFENECIGAHEGMYGRYTILI